MSDSDDLPMCDTCGTYAEWCQCPPAPPERAILLDMIAELRDTAAVKPGATGRLLMEIAGSAEARLREVTGDE